MFRRYFILILAAVSFALFSVAAFWGARQPAVSLQATVRDRVVISAPVLTVLFAGDRFLAANLETMRLAATGHDGDQIDAGYVMRAQKVVAELNACHEDNYYLANGLLTWGGAVAEGNDIVFRAMNCRFWDGIPPFFYGVNRVFFDRNRDEAIRAFNISAERWPDNAAVLRRLAITLRSEQFSDERLAVNYLTHQRDSTDDPKLRDMLDKRVVRLQGLVELREAQRVYEKSYGPLQGIQQLVERGVLSVIPVDPLRLGYELKGGLIQLKKLKIAGAENLP